MMTIEEVVAGMPQTTVFSAFDTKSCYWQVKLDEASSKLSSFNTPYGRYRNTKETLAILYGVQKFQKFIYGRPTEVESDHKPCSTS